MGAKFLILLLSVLPLWLWGGCQSGSVPEGWVPDGTSSGMGARNATSARQLIDCQVDQSGVAHIVAFISPEFEGLTPSLPVQDEPPGQSDHGELLVLLRAEEQEKPLLQGSVLPFRRYPYRWTLEGTSTQLSSVVLSEPRAVYVTDYAWSFRPAISAFPTADGTYTYRWVWSVWRDRWLPGGDAIFAYTLSGGGTQATLTLSVNGYYPTVLHSGGPLSSYSMTLGLLMSGGEMRTYDEEYLENWVAGTWSLTHNLNGVTGEDGKLDLRMLRTRPAAVPRNFQPELGETTSIQGDVLALPVATELFPQGWDPTGNLEWRIQVKLPYYPWQLMKTFTGTAPVSAHDSNGKVAHFEQVWDGKDGTGTDLSGPILLLTNAIAPVETSGNARTREDTTAILGPMLLEIENLRADPEVFDPARETTALSASIATRAVTDVRHQVVVKNHQGTSVRTFPERSGVNVRELWDGRNDLGGFPGYGEYTWEVKATCAEGLSDSQPSTVSVEPPMPKLVKIEFEDALPLRDDSGSSVRGDYYQDKNGAVTSMPAVITFDHLAAATAVAARGETSSRQSQPAATVVKWTILTFEKPDGLLDPNLAYDYKLFDSFGKQVGVTPKIPIVFGRDRTIKRPVSLEIERVVQKIDSFTVIINRQGSAHTKTVASPAEPLYITLGQDGDYAAPFNSGKEGKGPPKKLLERAVHYAQRASTPDQVRDKLTVGLYHWLTWRHPAPTGYNANRMHLSGGTFNIGAFERDVNGGSCQSTAAFLAVHCAALGVPMPLRQIEPSRADLRDPNFDIRSLHAWNRFGLGPDPDPSNPFPDGPSPGTWPLHHTVWGESTFLNHMVGWSESKVWDPTAAWQELGPAGYFAQGTEMGQYLRDVLLRPTDPNGAYWNSDTVEITRLNW